MPAVFRSGFADFTADLSHMLTILADRFTALAAGFAGFL